MKMFWLILALTLAGCASTNGQGFNGMRPDDMSIPYKALRWENQHHHYLDQKPHHKETKK